MCFQQGDCFFNAKSKGVPSHPWVIVSDPQVNEHDVLIVNLTDIGNIEDTSCTLCESDHPTFITKPCCVNYAMAKVTSLAKLKEADGSGLLLNKATMPNETLDKILAGAYESDELKGGPRALLRKQGIID